VGGGRVQDEFVIIPRGDSHFRRENRCYVGASSEIQRYLATLSHMFTVAVKEWRLVDRNPLRTRQFATSSSDSLCVTAIDE